MGLNIQNRLKSQIGNTFIISINAKTKMGGGWVGREVRRGRLRSTPSPHLHGYNAFYLNSKTHIHFNTSRQKRKFFHGIENPRQQ